MTAAVVKTTKRLTFEQREKIILEAAYYLFASHGYKGTTTKAIAKQSGVNEALLFRHFSSKEELYERLLQESILQLSKELKPVFDQYRSLPIEQALFKFSKFILKKCHQDPYLICIMLYAALDDAEVGKMFFQGSLPMLQFTESLLEQKAKEEEIKVDNIPMLARSYLSMLTQYIQMKEIFKNRDFYPLEEEDCIKFFIKIFSAGLKA